MTFMNLSGQVGGRGRPHVYKIPVERMLVIHDEVELPFGEVRLKEGQGLGGHNGLRSLEQSLGIARLLAAAGGRRAGPSSASKPLIDHVLASVQRAAGGGAGAHRRAADLAERVARPRRGDASCPA